MNTPLCDHKELTWMACPECARLKLLMQLAEADEDFGKRNDLQAQLGTHMAGVRAEMEMEL